MECGIKVLEGIRTVGYNAKVAKRSIPSQIKVLRTPGLESQSWLIHGFSTRTGGVSSAYGKASLNLGITKHDSASNVEKNRQLFVSEVGAVGKNRKPWPVVGVRQIHSAIIHRVDRVPDHALAGDGLISNTPGLLLAVKTADCVPVLLVDPERHAVGAFHAGWKGTLARIVEKGVGEMRKQFNSDPQDIRASIGPCIHACCYEVGEELKEKFEPQFAYAGELFREVFDYSAVSLKYPMLFLNQRAPGHGDPAVKIHLDLVAANRRQLLDAGVAERNIGIIDLCTSCRTDMLFSHRKEAGNTGRMMGVIGIRSS